MTLPVKLQALREIDKLDKIGPEGVRAMLTAGLKDASGAFNPGLELHPFQADFLIAVCQTKGDGALPRIKQLVSRVDLMCALEAIEVATGETAWDRLLSLQQNQDETWATGGRPNIAWALDDLARLLKAREP